MRTPGHGGSHETAARDANPFDASTKQPGLVARCEKWRLVMSGAPSKNRVLLARWVLVIMIGFVILGLSLYGFSGEVRERIWQNLLDRPGGPMTFRFFLQPVMATIAAMYDGINDARTGRTYYLWTILTSREKRMDRLDEGLISTARVLLLGLCMDLIYQYIAFDTFHPGEAVIISVLLAFVPYLLLRGPIARIARWWRGDASAGRIR
jgi:hypothetical protein